MKSQLLSLPSFLLAACLLLPAGVTTGFGQQAKPKPATLKLAAPIGDNMVLQRDETCSVWGTAPAGAPVSVDFAGTTVATKADADGNWEVPLDVPGANAKPQTMTISTDGRQTVTVKNILIGDVWICSGQSNMRWTVDKSDNPAKEKAAAKFPNIRLFTVANQTATEPQRDCSGSWEVCSPKTVGAFSGVGYFFGRELHEALDIPIGLVNNAWGGKPVEAFTSPQTLAKVADAQPLLAEFAAKQKSYKAETAKANYDKALATWETKVKEIRAKAKETGKKPARLPRKPAPPTAPNLAPNYPSAIYHQMVAPWTKTAVSGAIWYQGESNQGRAVQYRSLFPALIEDWRAQWNNPDMPVYWVQLANFRKPVEEANTDSAWAELQEAQTMTLKLPKTGMAIINDIGLAGNIHPPNKQDAGKRLSRWALAQHYGKAIDPVSGPLFERHEVIDTESGTAIRVHMSHTGSGLKTRDGGAPGHFEIAGEDQTYVWADASIDAGGKSVTVRSDKVKKPVAVRYAWADNPVKANLVNSAGLPTSLFRSDDWKRSTAGKNTLAASRFNVQSIRRKNEQLRKGGWEVLFDGETTKGFRNPYDWGEVSVANGEIHLRADKKFFLVTEKQYGDFHFTAEVKLPEGPANSGFMFRCHVQPNKVWGYQAEVDGSERRWSGGLYDEGRRKWIWPSMPGSSQKEFLGHSEKSLAHFATDKVKNALKRNDWNRYDKTPKVFSRCSTTARRARCTSSAMCMCVR